MSTRTKKAVTYIGTAAIITAVIAANIACYTPPNIYRWEKPATTPQPTLEVPPPVPTQPTPQLEPHTPKPAPELPPPAPELVRTYQPPTPTTITLYPIDGIHSQTAVDTGQLVTWSVSPLILAGHDTSGWHYIDDLLQGTIIVIATGPGQGTYTVTGNYDLQGKDHTADELPAADLILQTCTNTGLGFTLATRNQ